jgi:polyisoprenoid-binding protein YceI
MKYAWWTIVALTLVVPAARSDALAGSPANALVGTALQVADGSIAVLCPLTVGGRFEAKTNALNGELTLDPARQGSVLGEFAVDLQTLQTGIGLRDTHMREKYLEVQKGGNFAVARLNEIRLDGIDPQNPSGKAKFRGVLTLHGTEREVTGVADIRNAPQGARVQATFPLKVSEFQIPSPSYLGVGVRDEVSITVNFKLEPKRAS